MVKWGNETEKLREARVYGYGKNDIPNEKLINSSLGDFALFPGNFGMKNVGENSGSCGGNEGG